MAKQVGEDRDRWGVRCGTCRHWTQNSNAPDAQGRCDYPLPGVVRYFLWRVHERLGGMENPPRIRATPTFCSDDCTWTGLLREDQGCDVWEPKPAIAATRDAFEARGVASGLRFDLDKTRRFLEDTTTELEKARADLAKATP